MRKGALLLFASLSILLNGCGSGNRITRRDAKVAEKLIGIEFSEKEQKTMLGYLQDNRRGYDSMRKIQLDYGVGPAIYFDPKPLINF